MTNRYFAIVSGMVGLCLLLGPPLAAQSAGNASGGQNKNKGKLKVGVASVDLSPALARKLKNQGALNSAKQVLEAMDDQLIDRLHNTRKFKVIARSDLKALMKEADFQADAFEIDGLDYLVKCSADGFVDSVEKLNDDNGQEVARRRRIQLSAVTKIYNTNSGALKESANQQLEKVDARRSNPNQTRTMNQSNKLLVKVSRDMAAKVSRKVMDVLYPAKIVAKFDDQVMINRGKGTGIEKGETWTVFAQQGGVVRDPDTGEILSKGMQVPVGKVKITEVTPKFSRAKITEDRGIAKLQVLRLDVADEDGPEGKSG